MGIELLFILFLCLLIFGPKKLPEITRQIGRMYAEFTKVRHSVQWQLEAEVRKLEASAQNVYAPAPIIDALPETSTGPDRAMDAEDILKLLIANAKASDATATEKARSALVPSEATAPAEPEQAKNLEAISLAATPAELPVQRMANPLILADRVAG